MPGQLPWARAWGISLVLGGRGNSAPVKPKGAGEHVCGCTWRGGEVLGPAASLARSTPSAAPHAWGSFPPPITVLSLAVSLFWSVQGSLRDKLQNTSCVILVILHKLDALIFAFKTAIVQYKDKW